MRKLIRPCWQPTIGRTPLPAPPTANHPPCRTVTSPTTLHRRRTEALSRRFSATMPKEPLLTDPFNRLAQTPVLSSSAPNLSSASAAASSPLRLFGSTSAAVTSQSVTAPGRANTSSPVLIAARRQYKSPRASPINGTRQQHEIQRHLNRVKQGQKSQPEDDVGTARNSANNNNGNTSSNNNTATSNSSNSNYGNKSYLERRDSVDQQQPASPSLHNNIITRPAQRPELPPAPLP